MSIYIGNLSYEVKQEDLQEVFGDYGEVKRVHLPQDRQSGRPRSLAPALASSMWSKHRSRRRSESNLGRFLVLD